MKRIFMVGDSFAAAPKQGDEYRPWYIQTAEKLQMNCENHAMIGVSQDWCFWKLSIHLKELTAEDQILVVLTHPGRFWFFDDKPQMTNPNIVNIDKELSKDQLDAVLKFMTHIQRPPLDTQQMAHRIGWLDAQIQRYKLKPAHILCAFPLTIDMGYDMSELEDWNEYKNVIISNGLMIVAGGAIGTVLGIMTFTYFSGIGKISLIISLLYMYLLAIVGTLMLIEFIKEKNRVKSKTNLKRKLHEHNS